MYIVTTTFEKSSPDTPYYIDSNPDLKLLFTQFLQFNGSMLQSFITTDIDTTTQVSVAIYASEADFQAFMQLFNEAFPTFFQDRDLYDAANGITVTRVAETTV